MNRHRIKIRRKNHPDLAFIGEGEWAAIAPELLWAVWGTVLGVATLASYWRHAVGVDTAGAARTTKGQNRYE